MKRKFLEAIAHYNFRDEKGHPIANCIDVEHFFNKLGNDLDAVSEQIKNIKHN